jgi:hypothetical protein
MSRFKIIEINPNEIAFIKKNARYMNKVEYEQLVTNIKRDGQLSSTPFISLKDGVYTVISGNHRVKASIDANLLSIHCMVGENLSQDEIRAIQLSHNSISGKDDLTILKDLFEEIKSVELQDYAFIDNSVFDELEKMDITIVQPTNEFISIGLMFFDAEFSKFEDIVQEIKISAKANELVIPMPKKDHKKFSEVVTKLKSDYNIKDYGAALIKMAYLADSVIGKNEESEIKNETKVNTIKKEK